jgi:hypothetical protein
MRVPLETEANMKNYWLIRLLGVLVLLFGIALIGYAAYAAGVAQGHAAQLAAPAGERIVFLHRGEMWNPLPGLLFLPILLFLAFLFLNLFVFIPLRMIFGAHRMPRFGRWNGEAGKVPAPFEEWHKRMHESESTKPGQ